MSTLRSNLIEPLSGTTVTLGASGDAVTVPAGATVKSNVLKDGGGNALWTSDGAGNLSGVNTAIGGSMTFISSLTASDSAALEFTSGIDSTYNEYQFWMINICPASANVHFKWQFSTNGGSSYGIATTNTVLEAYHVEADSNATVTYAANHDVAQSTSDVRLMTHMGSNADSSGCGFVTLWHPSSTTYIKHFQSETNIDQSTDQDNFFTAGYINTTSAINAVKFYMSSGNIESGSVYMYGIKG